MTPRIDPFVRYFIDRMDFKSGWDIVSAGKSISTLDVLKGFDQGRFVGESEAGDIAVIQAQSRELIPLHLHISGGAWKNIKKLQPAFTLDRQFDQVMRECLKPRGKNGEENWIGPGLAGHFGKLHQWGYAHSLELYDGDRLAAGIVFLKRGAVCTSLTMFHNTDGAGTAAIAALQAVLCQSGFYLHDAVRPTPASRAFHGALEPLSAYLEYEKAALQKRLELPEIPSKLPVAPYARLLRLIP